MREFDLLINGFEVQAQYSEQTVQGTLLPILRKLTQLRRAKGRRVIAYLAAPPAAGKSTLAASLERLSRECGDLEPIQAVGIDGFHYHQEYILAHTVIRDGAELPMKDVKGCPETYDVQKLKRAILALREGVVRWPYYDRRLHDVVEDVTELCEGIILLEGNWLLLRQGGWADLMTYCDYSILLRAEEPLLRERLIGRKMRGGLSRDAAERFYETGDGPNVARCLTHSARGNLNLQLTTEGDILPEEVTPDL